MGFFVLQVPSDRTARRSGKALNHLQPDGCGLRNNWHADSRGLDGNRVAPSVTVTVALKMCNTLWKGVICHNIFVEDSLSQNKVQLSTVHHQASV